MRKIRVVMVATVDDEVGLSDVEYELEEYAYDLGLDISDIVVEDIT